jgi:tetratricopeptide (TPR) repeat protein
MKGFGENNKTHHQKKISNDNKIIKDRIINKAFTLHSQGNISEAKKYYENFIKQGFVDHRVFANYGMILINLGELKKAENYTRKAIGINPNYAMGYSNLGNIFQRYGELKKAEVFMRKAIELDPNFSMAYFNLGNIFQSYGELKKAEVFMRKAVELDPNFSMAHFNLGNIIKDLGKAKESLDSFIRVIEINPQYVYTYNAITELLKYADPSQFETTKLKKILNLLLEKNDVNHRELFRTFNFLYKQDLINSLLQFESNFSKIELITRNKAIMNAVEKIIFCDPELEKVLRSFRRNICYRIAKKTNNINENELDFLIALGKQCFLNEYIYFTEKQELISINKIIERCEKEEINEITISLISCYFPLYKLKNHLPSLNAFNSTSETFKELIKLQFKEPLKENQLSKSIKSIGKIRDNISQKVKSQYEENPYPRWRFMRFSGNQKIFYKQSINHEITPNKINDKLSDKQLKVLIAGCGTGKQILQAVKYQNSKITAIDLSLSSLAYAKRKLDEIGIKNVELIQMDILEIKLLKTSFDIIECGGVLHHMENPAEGLKLLLSVLDDSGFLKLGIYSELARQTIVKARKYIKEQKLEPTDTDIRFFREKIMSGELNNLNSLQTSEDFYSLSQCRDLCFHSKEHRFTIQQLKEIIINNKLNFLGFFLPKEIKNFYGKYFPQDTQQIKLENWEKFENKHPATFNAMYQFWVNKITY